MLSPLSRGYGTWSGRVEYSQPNGPSRENTFPSIGERNLTGISLSASIGTKLSAPTAPLQPPQPPTREPSYGEMYLPKTYLTRKGALLLFTAPESELDDSDFNARWQRQRLYKMRRDRVAKLIDLSLRLGNLTRLSNSVLRYGNQDFDSENASISDEKNKQFLKFLQNLDQKEVDTHAKPGGDLEFYLRDLKSRGSARYVVSGDTYLPKSRISQELQALLHGLDANCPSFSQEASFLGERSHSRLSDQFTRPVSRASSRAQSPGSAPPSTPKSYNVLSCKKLTASIKSSNYLGRPSSTEPLQENPPAQDVIPGVGISPAEEGTDGSGFEGYISPLTRKLFRMPGTQPSVAGSSIAEEEESLDNLSRTLKERATSPGMPLIYQGREVKGCSGEGKGDGDGQDLHKGEVDKFEFEGKRVTEVKYSEPDDVINAFIESDPLDEISEDTQEITEVSMEISQKKLSQEDMTVVEDESIHINESDISGTVDQSDIHIVNEISDHEAEEHDGANQIKEEIDDNPPEETVSHGDISSENEVEEEHCIETQSMSEKLSQKEDDKMSMSSGQTDLTSEKSSVKVTGVSHVEIKVTDKVARVTREEVDVKAESDLITEEIDNSSNIVTNQTNNNHEELEVLEVVKEKEEKENEVVVVEDGEHTKMGEVTGEESEDEDKVDEVLLERFRKGGSLFSMQSEEVLAQYQETDASSKSELSHLTQLANSIGGKVPKAPGKGKKHMGAKNRQKSSTSLDKTDTISETTSSVGSKRKDSFKIPEHMKDAMARRPSLSKEELEKEMERMSEMVDATLSGPTLHSIGEGLTEEELELAKQILQEKLAAAKEKLDDPKGQGKKSPVSKSASSRKSKKKDDKSDIEKEQEAIREKHEREKKKWKRGMTLVIGMKNREEEVRALQEKIAERRAMLKQQKDLNEAKTKEIQEEMDRLQQEADEIQRTEDDVRAQLAEMKRKQREERQARKNEMLEKKKQEIAAKREKERKEAEEKRKKEQEMHEKIADAEMRRRLREEEERNREEEERLAEERYMEEMKEQQRLAEEEEERARELERQAEEEAMQRLIEERNEAERQKRLLMEEKMRMEEESLREQEFELARQRQLEEEERKRLEEEQARKDQEMARLLELRKMEEKAKVEMQIALEQKRSEAILRRDRNLEARQNISQLKYRQAITRAWVFSYFIRWPRDTFEQPIGGKQTKKKIPRAKTPKPDSGVQKPS